MWQKKLQPLIEAGKLVAVGVVQEQHPERTKLYRQWRQLGWPIFVDSLNLLGITAVPIPIGIDESGIVRESRPNPRTFEKAFVHVESEAVSIPPNYNRIESPDLDKLRAAADKSGDDDSWKRLADGEFLHGGDGGAARAVEAYRKALELAPDDGAVHFRLGVAFRKRADSSRRKPGDAQLAVDHWGMALAIDPNQYIWRRRIQQYGPRLDKPYNFYFWVDQARRDIQARGETPVVLTTEPSGSELQDRPKRRAATSVAVLTNPDPNGRVGRDHAGMVEIEPVVAPSRVRPGQNVRVRLSLRVNKNTRPYWNNEADELLVSVHLPSGVTVGEGTLTVPNPSEPETREDRTLEFELKIDRSFQADRLELPGYALYYVCENKGGKCRYLRQDFSLTVVVDALAPVLR